MDNLDLKKVWLKNQIYIFVVIGVTTLWFLSWVYIKSKQLTYEQSGQFGDQFGFINSLFSGLAFGGIIISLVLQRKELSLQRKELRDTRKEFSQQNFESTFFNLLKNQQDITKNIELEYKVLNSILTAETVKVENKKFFIYSKIALRTITRALSYKLYEKYDKEVWEYLLNDEEYNHYDDEDNLKQAKIEFTNTIFNITEKEWETYKGEIDEIKKCKLIYTFFFKKYQFVYGHYFRHLYHILKFLSESEEKEKSSEKSLIKQQDIQRKYYNYAQFLQAQMSTPELFLLFYNCFLFPKLIPLISKYHILDNLPIKTLLHPSHNCLQNVTLVDRFED